jgi:hypothetical protein
MRHLLFLILHFTYKKSREFMMKKSWPLLPNATLTRVKANVHILCQIFLVPKPYPLDLQCITIEIVEINIESLQIPVQQGRVMPHTPSATDPVVARLKG